MEVLGYASGSAGGHLTHHAVVWHSDKVATAEGSREVKLTGSRWSQVLAQSGYYLSSASVHVSH